MTRATADRAASAVLIGWAVLAVATTVLATVASGGLAGPEQAALLGAAITRSGMTAAGVGCVGLALLGVLLPMSGSEAREAAATRGHADRMLVVIAGAWIGLVLTGIAFRAADVFGEPVTALDAGQLLRWSTELAAGRGLLLSAGGAVVVLGCAAVRLRDPARVPLRVPLVAALLGVLTPAVTGHASTSPDHQVAVITIAVHVGAAALWVGGLGALLVLVAGHRRLLDEALPRFSTLAGTCVAAVGVTGVVSAAVRLPSWTALVASGYGALVLAKAACLVLIACLGGLARRRLATGRTPVLRWAGVEVTVMAATLGLAAALTQAA